MQAEPCPAHTCLHGEHQPGSREGVVGGPDLLVSGRLFFSHVAQHVDLTSSPGLNACCINSAVLTPGPLVEVPQAFLAGAACVHLLRSRSPTQGAGRDAWSF